MRLYKVCSNFFISTWPQERPPVDIVVNVARKVNSFADIHIPLRDVGDFDCLPYLRVKNYVVQLLREEKSVLLHCYLGRNRSPFVAALVYHELYGNSGMETVRHIFLVRPNVLDNRNFLDYLMTLP